MMNRMHVLCLIDVILRFLEFARDRLAGHESPPDDTYILCWFWVPEEELPGGTSLAVRRHMALYPVFWVFMKGLAVTV